MKHKKIHISPPTNSKHTQEFLLDALNSGFLAPNGSYNQKFEEKLETYFNHKVLLTNSGTSAIHLALIQRGIQKEDVVLCSSFTFAASAFPILYQRAIPYFIDVESETWNLCPELLTQTLGNLKKKNIHPKALILTHSYGVSAKLTEIETICKAHNIFLIEDAAEALGSFYKNKPLGTFGNTGIISFNGNKIITTSAGGALISGQSDLIENARKIANQAKEISEYYLHKQLGYNYSMSNLLAAVGYAQFQTLKDRVVQRREIFEFYKTIFLNLYGDNFSYPKEIPESYANRWLSAFSLPTGEAPKIMRKLSENNIETRRLWNPMHKQPIFKEVEFTYNGAAEKLFKNGLVLPSGNNLTKEDKERIKTIIES